MSKPTSDSDRNDLLLSAIERLQVVWLALQAPESADIGSSAPALAGVIAVIQHDLEQVHSDLTG